MKYNKKYVNCFNCLFSSGIVADGKGTKCKCCGGKGRVTLQQEKEHKENYEY